MKSILKTSFLIVIVTLLVIFSSLVISAEEEEPVEFPNRDVEMAVKQQLGKATGNVYPSELKELKRLKLPWNLNIEDISWVKYCENLERFSLGNSNLKDLSPLSSLRDLRYLSLKDNHISDLTALSELYKIRTLILTHNEITDIQPLVDNYKVKEDGEKTGLVEESRVYISSNNLDLSEGSEDLRDIQTLLDRGVEVEYYPQKD